MQAHSVWTRALYPLGLAAMLVGTIDPLEGSLLIVIGIGLIALDAYLALSRYKALFAWSFALVVCGVAAMWGLSSVGGFRLRVEGPGLGPWWGLFVLPYPVGWVLSVVGVVRTLVDHRRRNSAAPRPAA